ncbi:ABC transporter ATP-binding protein [Microbacterium sp. LjRoot45]|uniref:ABC transporter ATP-binding protein n=1 Tax=Microbacterium sp. LjRoot45 TaxID=3342329 RepID=UPI003ECFE6FC
MTASLPPSQEDPFEIADASSATPPVPKTPSDEVAAPAPAKPRTPRAPRASSPTSSRAATAKGTAAKGTKAEPKATKAAPKAAKAAAGSKSAKRPAGGTSRQAGTAKSTKARPASQVDVDASPAVDPSPVAPPTPPKPRVSAVDAAARFTADDGESAADTADHDSAGAEPATEPAITGESEASAAAVSDPAAALSQEALDLEPERDPEPEREPEPESEPESENEPTSENKLEPESQPEVRDDVDPTPEPATDEHTTAAIDPATPSEAASAGADAAPDADVIVPVADGGGDAPAVRLRNIAKSFGETRAVDDIDLSIPAGTFYGIVGPNGAGKTTTLSMIAGLLRPDRGSVEIAGVDLAAEPARAKRMMGILPDRLRTFDRLTGRQLLHYYGVLRGLAPAVVESRVADLARAFDLTDALGRTVADYSAGMTKKVMLAGAMIHSPRVLVLDEPFEAVDPVSSAVILDILTAYVSHGGTVLLSSHGMDLVERVCSGVAVIVAGQVLAEGTVDAVRGELTLEQRFVELAGGLSDVEGLEWLHTFSG